MGRELVLTGAAQLADKHVNSLIFREMQIAAISRWIKLTFKKASIGKINQQLELVHTILRKKTV